jgi:spore protease
VKKAIKKSFLGKLVKGDSMSHEIDLSQYKIRTDLLIETLESSKEKGIELNINKRDRDDIRVSEIDVDEKHEQLLNKKRGRYITIEYEDITDHSNKEKVTQIFKEELKEFINYLKIGPTATCLIIGLGNERSTPDSLGPEVVHGALVTKHLFDLGGNIEKGFREVSAFSPGVMGTTGIETSKIILGVVEQVKPDFLIVIDALASQSITRVNKTIQMTDTGINPGSGVGNRRTEISSSALGIPVIAIGIPTVVDAVTIVSETINYIFKHISYQKENIKKPSHRLIRPTSVNYMKKEKDLEELNIKEKTNLLGLVGELTDEEMKELIYEVLTPIGYNLMVTPKEIDFLIQRLGEIISVGINGALHQKMS